MRVLTSVLFTVCVFAFFLVALAALLFGAVSNASADSDPDNWTYPADMPPFAPGQVLGVTIDGEIVPSAYRSAVTIRPVARDICDTQQQAYRLADATVTGDGTLWRIASVQQGEDGTCVFWLDNLNSGDDIVKAGHAVVFQASRDMGYGPWTIGGVIGKVSYRSSGGKPIVRYTDKTRVFLHLETCEMFADWSDYRVSFDGVTGKHKPDFVARGTYCELQFDTPLPQRPEDGATITVHLAN